METQRFKKRKKPNYKRAIILIILLIIIIYLWFSAEGIVTDLFEVKE